MPPVASALLARFANYPALSRRDRAALIITGMLHAAALFIMVATEADLVAQIRAGAIFCAAIGVTPGPAGERREGDRRPERPRDRREGRDSDRRRPRSDRGPGRRR